MTSVNRICCFQAVLLGVALAVAPMAIAGAAAAKAKFRPVKAHDEHIVFKAEDLGPGQFFRTFWESPTTEGTTEIGRWQTGSAEATLGLSISLC